MNEWTFYLTTDFIAVFYGDTINYGCSAVTKDLVSTFDSGKSAVCERSLTLDNYLNITLVMIDFDGHTRTARDARKASHLCAFNCRTHPPNTRKQNGLITVNDDYTLFQQSYYPYFTHHV